MLVACRSLGVGCMLVVERNTLGGEHLEKVCTTEQEKVCRILLVLVILVCRFVSWVGHMLKVYTLCCIGHSTGCTESEGCTG